MAEVRVIVGVDMWLQVGVDDVGIHRFHRLYTEISEKYLKAWLVPSCH